MTGFMQYIVLLLLASTSLLAQQDYETEYNRQYEENIKKEYINDVYIPASFEEAFEELVRLSEPGALEKFKNADEEVVSRKLHFGLGKWMMVKWNFEDGSRLSHQMREMGVTFPDDMIQFMIVSFHRHLNTLPLEMEDRALHFEELRKKEIEKRLKQSKDTLERNN